MLEKLHQAIFELLALNCDRKDLIICFSPIVKRYLEQEVFEKYSLPNAYYSSFEGIKLREDWPYNEIVVYDVFYACYHPELIRKIPVDIKVVTDMKITEVSVLPDGSYGIGFINESNK